MEWLDLDRLHSEHFSQGSGRTTRMLVEALAEVDFGAERVIIFGATEHHCSTLRWQLSHFAAVMGFGYVYVHDGGVDVEGCRFEVRPVSLDRQFLLFGNTAPVFRDHHAIEYRQRMARVVRDEMRKFRYRQFREEV
jgi:hypothetical protein